MPRGQRGRGSGRGRGLRKPVKKPPLSPIATPPKSLKSVIDLVVKYKVDDDWLDAKITEDHGDGHYALEFITLWRTEERVHRDDIKWPEPRQPVLKTRGKGRKRGRGRGRGSSNSGSRSSEKEDRIDVLNRKIHNMKEKISDFQRQLRIMVHERDYELQQRKYDFRQVLRATGFKTKTVRSDGNCFYDSLAFLMEDASADGLREMVGDGMHERFDKGELEAFGFTKERIDNIKFGKEWAGQAVIEQSSQILAIELKVWEFRNGTLVESYTAKGIDEDAERFNILYCNSENPLGEQDRNHYMPLISVEEADDLSQSSDSLPGLIPATVVQIPILQVD